jgi:hypothetical protein
MAEGDWNQMAIHVQAELERLASGQDRIEGRIIQLEISLAALRTEIKVKSGVWGMIGAAIPIAILLAVELLKA